MPNDIDVRVSKTSSFRSRFVGEFVQSRVSRIKYARAVNLIYRTRESKEDVIATRYAVTAVQRRPVSSV